MTHPARRSHPRTTSSHKLDALTRPTLGQFFAAAALVVVAVVATAFVLFVRTSRAKILDTAEKQQEGAALRVEARVLGELGRASRALDEVEHAIRTGAVAVDDQTSLEANLFTRVSGDAHLEEVAFTHATLLGYQPNGDASLAPIGRWQLSVHRSSNGAIVTRSTRREGDAGAYEVAVREARPDARFDAIAFGAAGTASDPTEHFTFSVIAAEPQRGQAIWSDLHWSEVDQAAAPAERRVVVSVQKTIEDPSGRFLGVLRVGLMTNELDLIARARSSPGEAEDVQRVALLAVPSKGGSPRLLARVDPSDRMVIDTEADEIRVVSDHPPAEIAALLASPIVRGLDQRHPNRRGPLIVDGERWLATLREINHAGEGGTAGWVIAVLTPEDRYTTDLRDFERNFMLVFGATVSLVVAIGGMTLIAMRRGLAHVTRATTRMRAFDFTPARNRSAFRDVDEVMKGLERAKTVVRAMGKYIPIDLVRRLYTENREPELGGEPLDISIMFTDIEGFTELSEKLPADELARRLGGYLEAMTIAIEATGGTIDKYIGDAVMALWNAPTPVPGHARRACRAVLACMAAADELYASSAWTGLPPMVTRFGLHKGRVLVGHFGAPTRLGYTALGDGVNLAARLEPLCKQYGVVVLVSESIVAEAKDDFVFRRVDRVAVKGKSTGIDVYELLGAKGDVIPKERLDRARRHEDAFDAYLVRDFERAAALLEEQVAVDPPSAILHARCRELAASPPPPDDWTGVHVASSK